MGKGRPVLGQRFGGRGRRAPVQQAGQPGAGGRAPRGSSRDARWSSTRPRRSSPAARCAGATSPERRLKVRRLSDKFIEAYLAAEWPEVSQCVGVFRIEALGVQLFESIEGDMFTVLGMLLLPVLGALRELEELPCVTRPYAEVIGDPIAQSKSPAIHGHWLAQLGLDGRLPRVPRPRRGTGRLPGRSPRRCRMARVQRHHAAQAGGHAAPRPASTRSPSGSAR